jgi:rare lipoprotein A
MHHIKLFFVIVFCLFMSACSTISTTTTSRPSQDAAPENPPDVSQTPDAVPKHEPKSRYGNMDSYEVFGKRYYTQDSSKGYVAHGHASWYGTKFHGNKTSSGELYDMYEMTAAHKTLPLPTYARVTNTGNGKSVVVKINDRGPFHGDRIIDLSYAAASKIGILQQGTGHVKVEAIDPHTYQVPHMTVAENKTPAQPAPQTVAAAPAPATPPANNAHSQWYLQLAAFVDKTYAEGMMDELETLIEQPMTISQNGNDPLYRVQVGPFPNQTAAQAYQTELANLMPEKPLLISR